MLSGFEAKAGLAVSGWQEKSIITKDGKSSEILITGQLRDIPANQVIQSLSLGFTDDQDIYIKRVISDNNLSNVTNSDGNYSFVSNKLTIKFPRSKRNNDFIAIYFSYDQKYHKINRFLRQEAIYVPSLAAGARAQVILSFPSSYESATLNPDVTKDGNNFIYSDIVPQDGVREIIKLTPTETSWNVVVENKISTTEPLGKFTIKMPQFFQNYHQRVENYQIAASIAPIAQTNQGTIKSLIFNTNESRISVYSKAKITTGINSKVIINRSPDNYLHVNNDEQILLVPILQQIIDDPNYDNIPLYAKIGQFVHRFIKYDLAYINKLEDLKTVVKNRVGVCTEYSRLFTALSRLAGIPTVTVGGIACGEYDKCQGHSWNIIYYHNDWIEVDPTWDLMSGIVSSSHVYTNDYENHDIMIEYFSIGNKEIVSSTTSQMSLD